MHLLYRRYARSGYAPTPFYIAMALAFAGVAVFGVVRGDWLIAAIALAMIAVTAAGSLIMRRLGDAEQHSTDAVSALEDEHGD